MPIHYLRSLTGKDRTQRANRHLAMFLSFVAGATNAGGFLVVHQYTSHMSGIVSAVADDFAVGQTALVVAGIGAVLAFAAGAATTALLVNWARRHRLHGGYAAILVLEACLLLGFGLIGARLQTHQVGDLSLTVMLLCFTMGLQNAMITKISKAEIRTTHVTGIVTDIGIELGKMFYVNHSPQLERVHADLAKLQLLASLLGLFLFGGVLGALGFRHIGFKAVFPLAALLVVLAFVPLLDDARTARSRRVRHAG